MEYKGITAYAMLIALFALFIIVIGGCDITGSAVFEDTLAKIEGIDSRHGLSLHDYGYGVSHFEFNPRFPDALNAGEIDNVLEEFEKIEKGLEKGSPSMLLVDAREELLLSEKFYKLGTKTKKGLTSDGFKCGHKIFITAATHNLNMSVEHGREAVESLETLAEEYPDKAERINITRFWVKYLNSTYDFLAEDAAKNEKIMLKFCS